MTEKMSEKMTEQRSEQKSEQKSEQQSEQKSEQQSAKNGLLEVVFILDRSGSMRGKREDTIGGFNSMLEKQQETSDNIIWSTILFDDYYETIHDRVPIQMVKPLTRKDYYVRGCTALLDAVGRTIHYIDRCHSYAKAGEAPEKTLFVITTDGLENASCKYRLHEVRQMIEEQQEEFGWEFIFLGSNIDAVREGERIGIRRQRCVDYIDDSRGMRMCYDALGDAMCSMSMMHEFDESSFDELREDYRSRGEDHGSDTHDDPDVFPDDAEDTDNGQTEDCDDQYGFSVDDPIEVQGISTEYFYLDNLVFEDGSPVFYERMGSWTGPKEMPIDKYHIFSSEDDMLSGNEPAAELYIYGYGKECSITAPKGFRFRSDEYVKAVTRPGLFIPGL